MPTNEWQPGLIIDESWELSDEQRREIARALGLEFKQAKYALAAIQSAGQVYRSWKRHDAERPRKDGDGDRSEIAELEGASNALGSALSGLSQSSRERLDRCYVDLLDSTTAKERAEHVKRCNASVGRLLGNLEADIGLLLPILDRFEPRGRPPKEAALIFVYSLANIWKDVHGKWPSRSVTYDSYDPDSPGALVYREGGPFHRFVLASMRAVDPTEKVPDWIVRKVCSMDKKRK